jgi:uncharacterized protein with ParB-like and HNH nuclease domain
MQPMRSKDEIKSEKILVKDIFSKWWFRIPEYQRPYVWGRDQIIELLGDLEFAISEKPDSEYFLGSFVFQSRKADPQNHQLFDENDLLDGQQRLATLLMLFAVLRDLAQDPKAKAACNQCIYQRENLYTKVPERTRIIFAIRDEAQKFVEDYIKAENGTGKGGALGKLATNSEDFSTRNMANAVLEMRGFFLEKREKNAELSYEQLLAFLLNNVLLIYVSTENLEDAFRLFTILNNRGIPLRNSDILKAINLGVIDNPIEKIKYAKIWERVEGELGDDFDLFLNYVRTILLKDKARLSLLQEFEKKIYEPEERDKASGQNKPALLRKGHDTFELVERMFGHHQRLLGGHNYEDTGKTFRFDNLVKVMRIGLPSTEWVPPLLRYFDKFGFDRVLDFLIRLDNKFSADWISQYTPTDRIEAMNAILRVTDDAPGATDVLSATCFAINKESLVNAINGSVYGRRFARYVLLKLDYLWQNHDQRMNFETLSVEHILPQNPAEDSEWVKDFTSQQRAEWTDKLGNLVLITGRKNSSQGRLDYDKKKKQYFEKFIDTCPNSLRVLQRYNHWRPTELQENHHLVTSKLLEQYGIVAQPEAILKC